MVIGEKNIIDSNYLLTKIINTNNKYLLIKKIKSMNCISRKENYIELI